MAKNSAHAKRNIVGFVVMHTTHRVNGEWVGSLDTPAVVAEFMIADHIDFDTANAAAWDALTLVAYDNRLTAGYNVWNIYRNGDRDVR